MGIPFPIYECLTNIYDLVTFWKKIVFANYFCIINHSKHDEWNSAEKKILNSV